MYFNISIKKELKTTVSIKKDDETVFEYEILNNKGNLVTYKEMLIEDVKRLVNIYRQNLEKLNVINLYLQVYSKKANISNAYSGVKHGKTILEKIKNNFSTKKQSGIKGVITNKRVFPQVNDEGITIYTIDILRNNSSKWERIYELETGMYNENGELKSFEQIKQRVKLDENDIISILNVLKNKEELEIMDSYLKNLNANLIDENFSYYIKY